MALEEGVLHCARAHAEAAGMVAQRREVFLPLADRETLAPVVGGDRADGEQELPGTDVQHAVAARVDEGQDGRGHRHADAPQADEQLHPSSLVSRCQHAGGHGMDPRRRVGLPQAPRSRALPAAHLHELVAREATAGPDAGQLAHQGGGGRLLGADELASQQCGERGITQATKRHRGAFYMGAPTWPPSPQRSARPGGAVARFDEPRAPRGSSSSMSARGRRGARRRGWARLRRLGLLPVSVASRARACNVRSAPARPSARSRPDGVPASRALAAASSVAAGSGCRW